MKTHTTFFKGINKLNNLSKDQSQKNFLSMQEVIQVPESQKTSEPEISLGVEMAEELGSVFQILNN